MTPRIGISSGKLWSDRMFDMQMHHFDKEPSKELEWILFATHAFSSVKRIEMRIAYVPQ